MKWPRSLALMLLAGATLVAPSSVSAQSADQELEYVWREAYFPSGDGTLLHADILRHPEAGQSVRTPVILSVGPYFNHSGQTATDYDVSSTGPSQRFFDFLKASRALERGYTYVMVDLRGFGGSAGCTDWGGPGEQADVKAAVEWAGSQPWSNGRVGVFGKSYDAWTGLMAIAQQPKHLSAVVSMEPVYDGYRYLYTDGVRYLNSLVTPALFVMNDMMPAAPSDSSDYLRNGTQPNAGCHGLSFGQQQNDQPAVDFWAERALIPRSRGAKTPLLLTQGFLESNTKPDGAFAYFAAMKGPKWAWFGQFNHVRAYETRGSEFLTGRDGFIAQTMRFFDAFLKDRATPGDPVVVVQSIDGKYRAEPAWPPPDVVTLTTALRTGSYLDAGIAAGHQSEDTPIERIWSISQPLPHAVHFAGEPVLHASVTTLVPRANLVANVYDVDAEGEFRLISRGASLLRDSGSQSIAIKLYGQDWPMPKGHRIAVAITGSNSEWWMHVPTNSPVTVSDASISLPFLRMARTSFLDGQAGPDLRGYLARGFQLDPAVAQSSQTNFTLPPPMTSVQSARGVSRPATPHAELPATGLADKTIFLSGIFLLLTSAFVGNTARRRGRLGRV